MDLPIKNGDFLPDLHRPCQIGMEDYIPQAIIYFTAYSMKWLPRHSIDQ